MSWIAESGAISINPRVPQVAMPHGPLQQEPAVGGDLGVAQTQGSCWHADAKEGSGFTPKVKLRKNRKGLNPCI